MVSRSTRVFVFFTEAHYAHFPCGSSLMYHPLIPLVMKPGLMYLIHPACLVGDLRGSALVEGTAVLRGNGVRSISFAEKSNKDGGCVERDCYAALISAGSLLGGEPAQTPGSCSHRAGVGLGWSGRLFVKMITS